MNPPAEKNQLLEDVLAENEPAGFRETILDETLRLAGRRRYKRRILCTTPLLVLCALALLFLPRPGSIEKPSALSVEIVSTLPLAAASIITTTPLSTEYQVSSTPFAHVVCTADRDGWRLIGDEELLAHASPRAAVLLRLGPDSQILILANGTEDRHPN